MHCILYSKQKQNSLSFGLFYKMQTFYETQFAGFHPEIMQNSITQVVLSQEYIVKQIE